MKKDDTILVVDDLEVNRAVICSIFENKCHVIEAENGRQALDIMEQNPGINVVLLDIIMPDMDGYQVLQHMNDSGLIDKIPVVVITSEVSAEVELLSFDLGARDIISKPFEPVVVKRRVDNIIELYRHKLHLEELVKDQSVKLNKSNEIIVDALSSVIESRSLESGQHIFRIRMFTKILLQEMARQESGYHLTHHKIELIASASSMHDIGKIAIPDSILNKPGRLTKDEFEIMKTHTTTGCKILKSLDKMSDKEYLQYAYNICRYHHERFDGNGYPDGLKGDNIPLSAQAVSVADAYDALTTDRVYKSAYSHKKAMDMILHGECGVFNPKILKCLINVQDAFESLSKEYADGSFIYPYDETAATLVPAQADPFLADDRDQLRLTALLKYARCSAVEFDLNTEYFGVLYAPDQELDILKNHEEFSGRSEFMSHFINNYVHPDDVDSMLAFIAARYQDFFEETAVRLQHDFRVLDITAGKYIPYRATFLRLKTDNIKQRKALVLLKNISEEQLKTDAPMQDSKIMEALQSSYTMTAVIDLTKDTYQVLHASENEEASPGGCVPYSAIAQEIAENKIHLDDKEYFLQNFTLENMRSYFAAHSSKTVLYRYLGKDRKYHWRENTLVKNDTFGNGDTIVYSLVKYTGSNELGHLKAERRDVVFSREIYPALLDRFKDIVFEYDLKKNMTYYSNGFEEKFGVRSPNNMQELYSSAKAHIHKDDLDEYLNSIKDLDSSDDVRDIEFRYMNAQDKYIWCRKRFLITRGSSGIAVKVNGIMTDVDRYKRENAILKVKSQIDQLTGLYNKITVQNMVEDALSSSPDGLTHALFIMDIDNFKIVNDIYGHLTGDKTLEKISNQISSIFEKDGIIGRVGGDEFIIFLKNIPDFTFAQDKAQLLLDHLNEILSSFYKTTSISVSIGISFYPHDSGNFYDLFTKADLALYEAKRLGKSQWRVYNESMNVNASLLKLTPTPPRGEHDLTDDFNIQILRNFYAYDDIEKGITFAFDAVARYCSLSHIFLYETYNGVKKLHEWNAKTGQRYYDLAKLSADENDRAVFESSREPDGILAISDTAALPPAFQKYFQAVQITALLHANVADSHMNYGFIGFAEHEQTHVWSQQEKEVCLFLAKNAALMYLKTKHLESMEQKYTMSNLYFNQIDAVGYVIDETFTMIEANQCLRNKMTFENGTKCYKLFQNSEKPCADCPVLKLNKSCRLASSCIYIEQYGGFIKVTASGFELGQYQNAYLITLAQAGQPE